MIEIRGTPNLKEKKIIIKLGTKAIFDSDLGKIRRDVSWGLARDVAELLKRDCEVMIVSSGAVGCGRDIIKESSADITPTGHNNKIGIRQAQAAIGQTKLMNEYSDVFGEFGLNVAQFLLSKNDLHNDRLENVKAAYENLGKGIIPIVNENDVTTTDELTFGDNDNLAAEVLEKLDFDILLILTDLGVLISGGGKVIDSGKFDVGDYDDLGLSSVGSGGLESKLNIAKRVVDLNKDVVIGKAGDSVVEILERRTEGTWFYKST